MGHYPYILHLGDSLDFMRTLLNDGYDWVITDPPYGIGVQDNYGIGNRGDKAKDPSLTWDGKSPDREYFAEIKRISENQIIWGANYHNCFDPQGGAIIWDKLQPLPDSSQCEIASISNYRKVFKYTQRWTNYVNTKETDHPTEKPISLFIWLLDKFTRPGDTIFDPFMGTGTTGVACMQLGRRFIGVEISPEYYAIAKRRIEAAAAQPLLMSVEAERKPEQRGMW